ncbi:FecR family protein [Catalinimonas niigatensis]|uniref:FecR family protein n=1 Tax=Catalinimonas niigatensis TaxID=1397264 RepID=UPI0026664B20|nr:FecR family protein [Catalinimonas niigatensis]WPP49761.1 FecR domain-containing protein [Catalinimonas niigatensis]
MAELRTLLIRYVQGKCNPEEIVLLKNWIRTEEGERILEEFIEAQWKLPDEHTTVESNLLFEKIQQNISKKNDQVWNERFVPYAHIGKYAASLIFIILSTLFLFHYLNREEPQPREVSLLTKETQKGQKRTLNLTDGTRVVLNAESKLTFPEHFSDTLRVVYLSGEAFFEVEEDKNRPFVVQTSNIHIQVLGTSFNLHAYEEDSLTQVALLEGKVSVQSAQENNGKFAMELTPGEMSSYHKSGRNFTKDTFDIKAMSGWKDGILYFKDADYDKITRTLERWYGVEFTYKGNGKPIWRYNGEFDDQSLEYVLESISYACKFSYALKDTQVIIHNP